HILLDIVLPPGVGVRRVVVELAVAQEDSEGTRFDGERCRRSPVEDVVNEDRQLDMAVLVGRKNDDRADFDQVALFEVQPGENTSPPSRRLLDDQFTRW